MRLGSMEIFPVKACGAGLITSRVFADHPKRRRSYVLLGHEKYLHQCGREDILSFAILFTHSAMDRTKRALALCLYSCAFHKASSPHLFIGIVARLMLHSNRLATRVVFPGSTCHVYRYKQCKSPRKRFSYPCFVRKTRRRASKSFGFRPECGQPKRNVRRMVRCLGNIEMAYDRNAFSIPHTQKTHRTGSSQLGVIRERSQRLGGNQDRRATSGSDLATHQYSTLSPNSVRTESH